MEETKRFAVAIDGPSGAGKSTPVSYTHLMTRGRLSPQAVETLYGRSYRMSASRIDRVNACHFAYFMEYGLRAKERVPAGFDAAQVGTFLHYILENVTREVCQRGGFAQVGDCLLYTSRCV